MIDSKVIKKLLESNELSGYTSPTSGRITYNKVVGPSSFGAFTDIITSIVPLEIVYDASKNHKIPSIAKTLGKNTPHYHIYTRYLFLNATMEEYMDYEDEEDNENMDELFADVSKLPEKVPIIGLAVQKSETMKSAHAIAFIAWHAKKRNHFAYYDPLAFKRGKKGYDFTDKAFVAGRFTSSRIEFINLNTYCFRAQKDAEDFHCSQYIINAEYCYIYSVFFLSKWIEFGHRIHKGSFRKAITSTYIVDPVKLTRSNTKESMIYRVVMMLFICETFLKFLKGLTKTQKRIIQDSEANIQRIKEYLVPFRTLLNKE
jgi:hypothetical protein